MSLEKFSAACKQAVEQFGEEQYVCFSFLLVRLVLLSYIYCNWSEWPEGSDQRTRSLLPQEDELTTALLDYGNPGAKLDRTDSGSTNIGQ